MKIEIVCSGNELATFINMITGIRDSAPAAEPAPKPAAKQKIELDVGKIKALHDAGWSMQKIADEMNVSMQTIANRLKEARNEQ